MGLTCWSRGSFDLQKTHAKKREVSELGVGRDGPYGQRRNSESLRVDGDSNGESSLRVQNRLVLSLTSSVGEDTKYTSPEKDPTGKSMVGCDTYVRDFEW